MHPIVVYYSRTGNTRKVGEAIRKSLNCDSEELIDTKKRSGPLGWLGAGKDAARKVTTKLEVLKCDLTTYDLVIIGTPIWNWTMSTPIRTFLIQYKNKLKTIAFFVTHGGNPKDTFKDMAKLCGKKPISTLEIGRQNFKDGTDGQRIKKFVDEITKSTSG